MCAYRSVGWISRLRRNPAAAGCEWPLRSKEEGEITSLRNNRTTTLGVRADLEIDTGRVVPAEALRDSAYGSYAAIAGPVASDAGI